MLIAAALIIAGAIFLMVRRVDVRLVLLGAGLAMAILAGHPLAIADTFTRGMVTAMVAPICASMGFAALMNATGCDRHLVHALLAPVRRLRWLITPGGILAAYLVNMAIPSQSSTAAALGPILVPLFLASGRPPAVAGAALVLGASFGGDLLNPGAQDIQAVAGTAGLSAAELSTRVIPAGIAGILVATVVFTLLNWRRTEPPGIETGPVVPVPVDEPQLRVNPLKAIIPLVPIALLLAAYSGWAPLAWLVTPPPGEEWRPLAGALPVVRAMLIGAVLGVMVAWREVAAITRAFFDGMGSAYANIISLTITAQCFGAGVAVIGMADALLRLASASHALVPLAAGFPWALSILSGSGSGPILAFAQTFLTQVGPADSPVALGAVACLGGAFGRTMSPVSAVVVYGSGLVGTPPLTVIRHLVPALLAGGAVSLAVALR
ncbi:MAG TPA: C4-dicarboxylate transporter DcuC [Gemmatimonadales bacterium]